MTQEMVKAGGGPPLWQQQLTPRQRQMLAQAAELYGLRPEFGELVILGDRPYVTAPGLARIAEQRQMFACSTEVVHQDWDNQVFVVKARLFKTEAAARLEKSVDAHGQATTKNTSTRVQGHLLEMAETRARNRAIRASYAIDLVSFEEMSEGSLAYAQGAPDEPEPAAAPEPALAPAAPTPAPEAVHTQAPLSDGFPAGPPPAEVEQKRQQALLCFRALAERPEAQLTSVDVRAASEWTYARVRQRYVKARALALQAGVDVRAIEQAALGLSDGINVSAASGG